jgi:hypothetical protein
MPSPTPMIIQGMNFVSPTNGPPISIYPGIPDHSLNGPSEQPPQTTRTEQELLALYNIFFPPIHLPTNKLIREITYVELVRRELLRTQRRKRLKKKKNKCQPPSPILSPITMASLLLTVPEPKPSPSPTHIDLDNESSFDIYFRACANHRPEMGESNAESVARQEAIDKDVERLKSKRKRTRPKRIKNTHPTTDLLTNHVQEIKIENTKYLYPNQQKRVTPTQHELL